MCHLQSCSRSAKVCKTIRAHFSQSKQKQIKSNWINANCIARAATQLVNVVSVKCGKSTATMHTHTTHEHTRQLLPGACVTGARCVYAISHTQPVISLAAEINQLQLCSKSISRNLRVLLCMCVCVRVCKSMSWVKFNCDLRKTVNYWSD